MKKTSVAFAWIVEIASPFHDGFMKRYDVIIVSQLGKKMLDDYHFETQEEAELKLRQWIDTHPMWNVSRLDA